MLAGGQELFTKPSLVLGMLARLLDGVLAQKPLGGEIEVEILARRARAVEALAQGEEVLPLRVGACRVRGRNGRARGFEAVRIADQGDDHVFLQAFDQCARAHLEILLHSDIAADRTQIARQRVAAGFELRGDGAEEDLHRGQRLR